MSDTGGEYACTDIPGDPENDPPDYTIYSDPGQGPTFRDRAAERAGDLDAEAGDNEPPTVDDILGPLYWPGVAAAGTAEAWSDLRKWVDQLLERFPHIDHHVIPMCWWRHNGHVEALAALRDHQRQCYHAESPPTAAMDWHRAFRDIEARLREWTSTLACGATHDPRGRPARAIDEDDWNQFVTADSERRAENEPQRQEEPSAPDPTADGQQEQTQ